jgi:hypothetical protein
MKKYDSYSISLGSQFEPLQNSMVNDCEFDFYGLRLATCDNKGYVHIVNAENE